MNWLQELIASSTMTIALVSILIWLSKNIVIERLRAVVRSEYKEKLEQLKADLKSENELKMLKFQAKIQQDNNKKLAKLQSELEFINTLRINCLEASQEIPRLIGETYSLAREILEHRKFSGEKSAIFYSAYKALENKLYDYTIHMEKDSTYAVVHEFKECARKLYENYANLRNKDKFLSQTDTDFYSEQLKQKREQAVAAMCKWFHQLEKDNIDKI